MTEALHVVLEVIQRIQATHEDVARAAQKPNINPARERDIEGLTDPPSLYVSYVSSICISVGTHTIFLKLMCLCVCIYLFT